jgi:hypothetical protein
VPHFSALIQPYWDGGEGETARQAMPPRTLFQFFLPSQPSVHNMTEINFINSNINCNSNLNTIPYSDHEDSHPSDINEVSDAPPSPDLRHVKIESLNKQAINSNIWKELPDDALSMKDRLPDRLLDAIEPSTSPDAKVRSPNDTESSRLILLSKRGRMPTLYMPNIDPPDLEGFLAPTIKWSRELLEGPIGFGRDNDARSGRPDLFGRNKHAGQPVSTVIENNESPY